MTGRCRDGRGSAIALEGCCSHQEDAVAPVADAESNRPDSGETSEKGVTAQLKASQVECGQVYT